MSMTEQLDRTNCGDATLVREWFADARRNGPPSPQTWARGEELLDLHQRRLEYTRALNAFGSAIRRATNPKYLRTLFEELLARGAYAGLAG